MNHWPATARRALPPLAAGEWITQGWVGAALRGSEIVAAGDASDQEGLLRAFLASALDESRALALEACAIRLVPRASTRYSRNVTTPVATS